MFLEILLVLVTVGVVAAFLGCAGFAAAQAVGRLGRERDSVPALAEILACEPDAESDSADTAYRVRVRFRTPHGVVVETETGTDRPRRPAERFPLRYDRAEPRTLIREEELTGTGTYGTMAFGLLLLAALSVQQTQHLVRETVTGWF